MRKKSPVDEIKKVAEPIIRDVKVAAKPVTDKAEPYTNNSNFLFCRVSYDTTFEEFAGSWNLGHLSSE